MSITKIISGGQTGVDVLALAVASSAGIQTGGACPAGYMTCIGPNMGLERYGLQPLQSRGPMTLQYVQRSIKNAMDSDGTLAFLLYGSIGTAKTVGYCITGKWQKHPPTATEETSPASISYSKRAANKRPCFIVRSLEYPESIVKSLRTFVKENSIRTLNVCGHRNSKAFSEKRSGVSAILEGLLSE